MVSDHDRRLGRLEQRSPVTTIVCPECGEKFTAKGDLAVRLIVAEWERASGVEPSSDLLAILDHEHDLSGAVPDPIPHRNIEDWNRLDG